MLNSRWYLKSFLSSNSSYFREKFGIGCVGVIFLGIAIEAMLCLRRWVSRDNPQTSWYNFISMAEQNSSSHQWSENLGVMQIQIRFPPNQDVKMNILQVVAKSANSAEVARSFSPSLNHLPFRSQYCLRISCYAGIENDYDSYRRSQFRWWQHKLWCLPIAIGRWRWPTLWSCSSAWSLA